ncbi:MAG: hypothetical protein C4551_04070 [Bacillota bacterium]|nr:MAG: hypothetical protein C4551_04070 [Bacillota bacterium]
MDDLTGRLARFTFIGVAVLALASCAMRRLAGLAALSTPFIHFLATVTVVKLVGDAVYFLVSPRYREITQLEDYLGNDFLTFYRFGLPLAIVQTLALNQAMVPISLTGLWSGPAAATILVVANRWLVEQATVRRRKARGDIPVVRDGKAH